MLCSCCENQCITKHNLWMCYTTCLSHVIYAVIYFNENMNIMSLDGYIMSYIKWVRLITKSAKWGVHINAIYAIYRLLHIFHIKLHISAYFHCIFFCIFDFYSLYNCIFLAYFLHIIGIYLHIWSIWLHIICIFKHISGIFHANLLHIWLIQSIYLHIWCIFGVYNAIFIT